MYTWPVGLLPARRAGLDRFEDLLTRRFPAEAAFATKGVPIATKAKPMNSDKTFGKMERDEMNVGFKGLSSGRFYMPGRVPRRAMCQFNLLIQVFDRTNKPL
jgi:hypothetical protein